MDRTAVKELNARQRELLMLRLRRNAAPQAAPAMPAALPLADRSLPLPLSSAQQRLWFLDQLDAAAGAAYHLPAGLQLSGQLDRDALVAALDRIVARHESLRTTFVLEDGEPVQKVADAGAGFPLAESDLRDADAAARAAALAGLHAAVFNAPFDLARGPLIRGHLVRLADDEHVLLINQHHIVTDGWSVGLLMREVGVLYSAFSQGQPDPLAPLPLQYADYAAWQRGYLQGGALATQIDYWKTQLAGAPALLALPLDRPRPAQQGYTGAGVDFRMPPGLSQQVMQLSQRHGVTLFMTLLAAWGILMARLAGQGEVVVGCPVANRQQGEVEELIGCFLNTLALRLDLSGNPSVADLLAQVKATTQAGFAHQDVPFEQVVEALKPPRNPSHSLLFQTVLTMNAPSAGGAGLALPGLRLAGIDQPRTTVQFDTSLYIGDVGGVLTGSLAYATALFDRATVERMLARYQGVLAQMVADDAQGVGRIDLLDAAERTQLAQWADGGALALDDSLLAHQLVEAHAAATPDAPAVAADGLRLTYRELNARANQVAHRLLALGVQPDDRVALCLGRGLPMLVGLLGILKAGAGYVPLDAGSPPARLARMLADCAPKALLTEDAVQDDLPAQSLLPVVVLDADALLARQPVHNPAVAVTARHLAYVIYTSGSTGEPKGVMVEHRALLNLWQGLDGTVFAPEAGARPVATMALNAALTFDASLQAIVQLLGGRCVALVPQAVRADGAALLAWLKDAQVDAFDCTPAQLTLLCEAGLLDDQAARAMTVLIGGEAIDPRLWTALQAAGLRAYNLYGPTECTVDSTLADLRQGGPAPHIGRPLANVRIHLLDELGQLAPPGAVGEVAIGGAGVARGYLHNPALTGARFMADPFSDDPGARLYWTGDLARWRPDGNLEYLGRNDFQVKLRGYRIEPGEIEAKLLQGEGVLEAAVLARADQGGAPRLVAYVRFHDGVVLEPAVLRARLAAALPEYMVPAAFVTLAQFPLTPHGKLDRMALPAPDAAALASRPYTAPEGDAETTVAGLWQALLQGGRVGRHDDFFELGGHSLLAVQLVSRLRQVLGVEVALGELFAHPTLAGFTARLALAGASGMDAIPLVDRALPLPLSWAQQRLWFLDQLDTAAGAAYHMPAGLRLTGQLDRAALRATLDAIVARHEVLRTTFELEDGAPVQRIAAADAGFALDEQDVGALDAAAQADAVAAICAAVFSAPFDLARGPLIRGRLLRLSDTEHLLLINQHHIISDGWSQGVLVREVNTLYDAFSQGRPDPLPPLALQYGDYAAWQRAWLRDEVLQAQAAYWTARLAGAPALLDLPLDRPRPVLQSFAGASVDFRLSPQLSRDLKDLGQRHGATLFMTLLAGWGVLLARLSGQADVVIGTPVANRQRREVEDLIGFFVNNLALRLSTEGDPTVAALLAQVKTDTLAAYAHQDIPFEQVVEAVKPVRSMRHSAIYQTVLTYGVASNDALQLAGLCLSGVDYTNTSTKVDLHLFLTEGPDGIGGQLVFSTALFDTATVERMVDSFEILLGAMAANDAEKVSRLALMDADAERALLALGAGPAIARPAQMFHQMFEAQAALRPGAPALAFDGAQVSYADLNERANQVAWRLLKLGVRPDDRVAICIERGVGLIAGILGILKAGAAYMPLDPAYPSQRLAYLLADSAPVVLLTEDALQDNLPAVSLLRVLLIDDAAQFAGLPVANPDPAALGLQPHHMAYVIYTSGSTGQPKGVMVAHPGLANLALVHADLLGVTADSRVLQFASSSFDSSVSEIVLALANGATLVLAPRAALLPGAALAETLRALAITHATLPSLAVAAMPAGARFDGLCLTMAGDACPPALAAHWAAQGVVFNGYGPTENTVCATMHRCAGSLAPSVPLGRPIANVALHILDAHGQLAPRGATGEIYLGGIALARGYLHRPELTAERFIADPFGSTAGARLYRTGDLGRWNNAGLLEYQGRADFQVKVRGYRIELGEIEARLLQHPDVRDAVVLARAEPAGTRLVAYVRVDADAAVEPAALRAHLAATLPDFMLPAAFVALAAFPLTTNGKLDRNALPAPDAAGVASRPYEAPDGAVETTLAAIWAALLRTERVGRRDDFFALGGHSLLAVQMVGRVREALGVEVALAELFAHPELGAFAARVAAAGATTLAAIPLADRSAPLPLSWAQQRLWFLDRLDPAAGAAYRVPAGLRLTGPLDRAALRATLDRIVARHENLRTTFVLEDGAPVQRIGAADSGFALAEHDLRALAGAERDAALDGLRAVMFGAPFDLARGPLARGQLVRLADDEHLLLINLHHIITDGWSTGVLVREVNQLYSAFSAGRPDPLPPLALQYADYAAWQRGWLQGAALEAQAAYWKGHLAGAPAVLDLPLDRPRPAQQSHAGASVDFVLPAALTQALRQLAQQHGATLFMALLAGWGILMARLAGQADVVIGSPVANRQRGEIEDLIGFFVNTLALRLSIDGDPTVAQMLDQVKIDTLAAYAHQGMPFEQVVEAVKPQRSPSHSPLFQTMLTVNNTPDSGSLAMAGITLSPLDTDAGTTHFDTSLAITERDGVLGGNLVYATDLFDRATVARMLARYQAVLEQMAADAQLRVGAIDLLDAAERAQLAHLADGGAATVDASLLAHQRFEACAAAHPDAPAVEAGGHRLTYRELNERSNQVAHRLLALGVKPDDRVALCLGRGLPMLVGIMGTLKAGAGYVPLDAAAPAERLVRMLADCAPKALLTEDALADDLPVQSLLPVLVLDADPVLARQPVHNPAVAMTARHLAYVIYTSGSTGAPKGVMVEHHSLLNLWQGLGRTVFADEGAQAPLRRIALNAGITFDASVKMIVQLLSGRCLLVVPQAVRADGAALLAWLVAQQVDAFDCTPAQLDGMCDAGLLDHPACRTMTVLLGGEALGAARWGALQAAGLRAFNLYGPTECTVDSALADLRGAGPLPHIGRPLENVRIHLFDAQGQLAPRGAVGEMVIGGAGVARGYLRRPDLTDARFVADPFSQAPGARLYRSGDLARWLPDGNLAYLGRNDFQVKLRGFRIELGEIEAKLLQCAGVLEAAVVAREDQPGDKRLVAYLRCAGSAPEPLVLRRQLGATLPDYMVPAAFVHLDRFPLSRNGKLDRAALPAPDGSALAARAYEPPRGMLEEAVAQAWQDLLHIPRAGRGDDFFDLGGHSLLAVQLISRLRLALGVEVALGEVFSHPVLAAFAARVGLARQATMARIPPADRSAPLPLSWAQQRLWFIDQLDPRASAAYHMPAGLRLLGQLDRAALRATLDRIVARHEVLRTTVAMADGMPVQHIADANSGFALGEYDVSHLRGHEQAFAVKRIAQEQAAVPFDLNRGPLIRGELIKLAGDEHVLLIRQHHIVSDGWSNGILVREVSALYTAFTQGRDDPLPPLPIQYADYAQWQRNWLQGAELQAQLDYWKAHLDGAPALLSLPTDRPRPALQSHAGGAVVLELSAQLSEGLRQLSQRHGVTVFMTLLAAWSALMGRLAGQDDIVVGTPVANRQRSELEDLIGFFVNTLAVRVHLDGAPTVAELLARVKAATLGAYAHQDLPFEQVVDAVKPQRSMQHSPLFQTLLSFNNTPDGGTLELPGLRLSSVEPEGSPAHFDTVLMLAERHGVIGGHLGYASELFDRESMLALLQRFKAVLAAMVADAGQAVERIDLLAGGERALLLHTYNDTAVALPPGVLLHALFEAQALAQPDAVAVVAHGQQLGYGELNRRANRLAHRLLDLGVRPDDRVALCVDRGAGMVVAILGILKAGAAYVPLDPDYPPERLAYMLADSTPVALVGDSPARVPATACPVLWLDATDDGAAANPAPRAHGLQPDHLAYVIYTSGSTGKPKGVMVSHANAVSFVEAMRPVPGIAPDDAVLALASLCFDMSVYEIFVTLARGARLIIAEKSHAADPAALWRLIEREAVTVVQATPSAWRLLVDHGWQATRPIRPVTGGEPMPQALADALLRHVPVLWNAYAPTETTVYSCAHPITREHSTVLLGKPIANAQAYVLDAHMQLVPPGVVGEVHLGGAGVTRGYLNRPELTEARFVPDPFSDRPGARLYKTGDLGRHVPGGAIEGLGRNDFQVKIRGFRIELGEIEARLVACDGVRDAVVLAREDVPGDRRLVAYLVGERPDTAALRAQLARHLADYMVPNVFVLLDHMPLTSNGKLDRQALPAPDASAQEGRSYEAPRAGAETAIAAIWEALLHGVRVGRDDDFFALGGHSVLGVQMVARVRRALHVDVPMRLLFTHPTLAAFAAAASGAVAHALHPNLVPVRPAGTRAPLFLVHAIDGEVGYVRELAQWLPPDLPVYGLTASGFVGAEVPGTSVEAIAQAYVQAIRQVQAEGPYRLAGWSAGGTIAYEMAQQLIGAGQAVAFVGLIDTTRTYRPAPLAAAPGLARAGYLFDAMRALATPDQLAQLQPLAQAGDSAGLLAAFQAMGMLPAELEGDALERRLAVREGLGVATAHYVAAALPAPVALFGADQEQRAEPTMGWAALLGARLQFETIPGDHFSLMRRPHVQALAAQLAVRLEQSAGPGAQDAYDAEQGYVPRITIQSGRAGVAPVFCIPGAGASITAFTHLAHALGQEVPLHGLQPRGLCGVMVPYLDVPAAARAYAETIRAAVPHGPYHLVGHSYGGWVATELARQLTAAGRPPASLIVLDSNPPAGAGAPQRFHARGEILARLAALYALYLGRPLGLAAADFAPLDAQAQLELLLARLVEAKLMPPRTRIDALRGIVNVFSRNLNADYQPGAAYPGPLHLVLAQDSEDSDADVLAAWRVHAPQASMWQAPGNHLTLLAPPHVAALAAWMGPLLLDETVSG